MAVALPAVAGAAPPPDLAEAVAVDVTYLTDCAAGAAGAATVGVASLADVGMVTVGVTDLAVTGARPWTMLGWCSQPILLGWSP